MAVGVWWAAADSASGPRSTAGADTPDTPSTVPAGDDSGLDALAYYELGQRRREQGFLDPAIDYLRMALRPESMSRVGPVLDIEEFRREVLGSLADALGERAQLRLLAVGLSGRVGMYDAALDDCNQAISVTEEMIQMGDPFPMMLQSALAMHYHSRGMIRAASGDRVAATADLREAIRLAPSGDAETRRMCEETLRMIQDEGRRR